MQEDNVILKKTFDFALMVVEYTEQLEANKKYLIARQLLKSGTSMGANIRGAQSAESRADFIHKFKIAAKEAEEAEYWSLLCKYAKSYPKCDVLIEEVKHIQRIVSKIIFSAKGAIKN